MAQAALLGGRYRLEQVIGSGGMATVWRAVDVAGGEAVAVKRLQARMRDDPELIERFRREAAVVERLSHPNLVRLLDEGADDEGPYLVFELVDGTSLKDLIRRRGKLAPVQSARICGQVALALQAAHELGVVHRDIKSQNVLVSKDGRARLTDFGIARLMAAQEAGLTRTGMMIGTSDYLAPEQARGREVDGRTDLYALGVVLYECLTGVLPFPAESPLAVALRHVQDPMPDPRSVTPDVPPYLAAAVLRACAKEPAARFPSAEAFAEALEDAPEQGTASMAPVVLPDEGDTGQIAREDEAAGGAPGAGGEDGGSAPGEDRGRDRRRWPWAVAGGAVIAAGGVIAVLAVAGVLGGGDTAAGGGGGGGGGGSAQTPPLVTLPAFSIQDYDPEGGGSELTSEVPFAYDGLPATSWRTERYATADFGNLKKGVGLIIRLQRPAVAREMDLTSPSRGGAFQVLGPLDAEGTRPVYGTGTFTGGRQTVPLTTPGPEQVYVLWVTRLPADEDAFRARVAEVSLRGPAK